MAKSNQMSVLHKTGLAMIVLAAIVAGVVCESDADGAAASEHQDSRATGAGFNQPKRQYFIAPRIGRSGEGLTWATAFGEGPSLVLPQHLTAPPNRASLLFLIGNNRRFIGPRSGGLMPQARIGRRASPSGLLPQPRVGRRSDLAAAQEFDSGNQQEVAVAALSDSSPVDEAIDALLSG